MGKVEIANCRLQSSKCKSGNRLKAVRNGVETRYIYDTAGNLIAEADGNNNITKYYVYGLGLIAMVKADTNAIYSYHYNAIGSTIAMTDMSRNIVNAYQYDPFGSIANQSETISQPFKFVGQFGVMTEPNGFYYMKARYYDPNVGRFISEDPIGFEGGDVNLMAYVGNQPINYVDPSGLDAFVVMSGNNIRIIIPVTYSGPGASPEVIQKFNKGIEQYWSGQFGQYKVTTSVVNGADNNIYIPTGNGRAYVQGTNTGVWPAERPSWTAAHEAGHLMGLPDRYDYNTGNTLPGYSGNIMGDRGGVPFAHDITDIINSSATRGICKP